jgi:hypothetical protein
VGRLVEVGWRLAYDRFEGGPDLRLEEMSAAGCSVGEAQDDVGVHLRSIVGVGDVTYE